MIAVDVSNYTTNLDPQALAAAGVKRVIVQIVNERVLTHREQIPALLAAGIEVEAYVYQWFSSGPEFIRHRMTWALDELAAFPEVRRVWLDCEQSETDDPPYGGGLYTTDMIREAVTLAGERAYEVGIYTAKWWWDRFQHEVTAFSMLPLWVAQYDDQPDAIFVPFGGWERCEMKQYAGDTAFAGVGGIDLSWYERNSSIGENSPISEEDDVLQLESLTDQAEAIRKVREAAEAVGPDQGQWFRVTGGYTPKPGRVAYLVEVVEG